MEIWGFDVLMFWREYPRWCKVLFEEKNKDNVFQEMIDKMYNIGSLGLAEQQKGIVDFVYDRMFSV